jgi:hypothetical protein
MTTLRSVRMPARDRPLTHWSALCGIHAPSISKTLCIPPATSSTSIVPQLPTAIADSGEAALLRVFSNWLTYLLFGYHPIICINRVRVGSVDKRTIGNIRCDNVEVVVG